MNDKYKKTLFALDFIHRYSTSLKFMALGLVWANVVIAIMFFWVIIFTYYEPYQATAILMLKFFRISIGLFIVGYLVHYISFFLHEIVFKKSMKNYKVVTK